jgi:hypothetical protein
MAWSGTEQRKMRLRNAIASQFNRADWDFRAKPHSASGYAEFADWLKSLVSSLVLSPSDRAEPAGRFAVDIESTTRH